MFFCIANILTTNELEYLLTDLDAAEFADGKITAGWHAKLVKNNSQLNPNTPISAKLSNLVQNALKRHKLFQMAVLPKVIAPIIFSRYDQGMSYGTHVDNVIMGGQDQLRSDISMTLFLSDPETYQGGELVIETTQGEQSFKLDAGSLVIYPSSTLHRVEPVESGLRLAAVTWIQSLVRDISEREILFDLDTARQAIFAEHGKTPEFDLLSKCYTNLLRKWIDL